MAQHAWRQMTMRIERGANEASEGPPAVGRGRECPLRNPERAAWPLRHAD